MPSSKGNPTDPKLREQLKEKIKNQPNSDGGGKGQWSAWKAAKLSKEYEHHGGSYENVPGSKNEPKQGTPEPKGDAEKAQETKNADRQTSKSTNGQQSNKTKQTKAKATSSTKADDKGETEKTEKTGKQIKKSPAREGTRRSSRLTAKRNSNDTGHATSAKSKTKKQKTSS